MADMKTTHWVENIPEECFLPTGIELRNFSQHYALSLTDHATPSFISGGKYYYGDLAQVAFLMDALKCDESCKENHKATLDAFEAFLTGNKEVVHGVAFHDERLLEEVQVIAGRMFALKDHEWTHMNVWDCAYLLHADLIVAIQVLLKHGKSYVRAVRPFMKGLRCNTPEDIDSLGWLALKDNFWGFPHMLISDDHGIESRLLLAEQVYNDLDSAVGDLNNVALLDYSSFCDEIFGDG